MKSIRRKTAQIRLVVLALVMLLFFAACPTDETPLGDFAWEEDGNGGITIIGYTGPGGTVEIPKEINGSPVRAIGNRAFIDKRLTSVIIPDSVTSIGFGAFMQNHLTSVTIPDGVASIGNGAFMQNRLTSVNIPDSVTSIGPFAFAQNHLTSVSIPDSVTAIGYGAFYDNHLTSVTIPDSVTSIWSLTFSDNYLTSITIPDSVTSIRDRVFRRNHLTSITIGAHVVLDASEYASFGNGFEAFYEDNGSMAGTYTRPDTDSTVWTWSQH